MKERLLRECRKLHKTYRAGGLTGVLHQLTRDVLAVLYHWDALYITMKRIGSQQAGSPVSEGGSGPEIECLIVDSVTAVPEVAREFPATMRDSVEQLRQRVAQGCIVILARRPKKAEPGREVLGYMLCERGVFSALGRRRKISADIFFAHYIEVLPEYRGQRIADVLRGARDEYCRAHGITRRCSVISPANESSLRSDLRNGATIVGTVVRVSILRGLVVWETPWERIEKALQVVDHAERPSSGS